MFNREGEYIHPFPLVEYPGEAIYLQDDIRPNLDKSTKGKNLAPTVRRKGSSGVLTMHSIDDSDGPGKESGHFGSSDKTCYVHLYEQW